MTLQHQNLVEIWCPICGYVFRRPIGSEIPEVCPACNDGEGWVWTKEKRGEHTVIKREDFYDSKNNSPGSK